MKILKQFILPVVLLVGALFSSARLSAQEGSSLFNQPAPAWTLKDLDGKSVSFEQFKGKVVVIDFWATWCGPCKKEIPGYIELQKKYGKDGLVIIGISIDQNGPKQVKKFVTKNDMNYTIVMGDDTIMATFGNFTMIPTTFLINREGKIIHQKSGTWAHDEYEALVKKAL